jgi:hypothetical protein
MSESMENIKLTDAEIAEIHAKHRLARRMQKDTGYYWAAVFRFCADMPVSFIILMVRKDLGVLRTWLEWKTQRLARNLLLPLIHLFLLMRSVCCSS